MVLVLTSLSLLISFLFLFLCLFILLLPTTSLAVGSYYLVCHDTVYLFYDNNDNRVWQLLTVNGLVFTQIEYHNTYYCDGTKVLIEYLELDVHSKMKQKLELQLLPH